MTDTSKERCEALAARLMKRADAFAWPTRQPVKARGRFPEPTTTDTIEGVAADLILALRAELDVARAERDEAEQRVIARLREPDDAMIEVVAKAYLPDDLVWDEQSLLFRSVYRRIAGDGIRALAAFLSSPPQEKTDG